MIQLHAPTGPAFEFLVLFLVIAAGPLIIERFKVPGIIGLLLGGLLIGPHGLELVGSGNTTVPDLGTLGLLYLMFVAGLELDLRLVNAHRRATGIYAALTFSLPLAAGIAAGVALGFSTAAAVLLGSLLASHTLVVYPVIRQMGRGNDPAVATGVGATVVTDTLTLIVLAAVSGVTVGNKGGAEIAVQVAVGLAVVVVGSFLVLPRVARLFLARFGTSRPSRYIFALVSMLAAASLAEVFGIEAIVGAFFAGLALNRLVPNEGDLMERIDFFGGAVFVPVFLVSVGLIINPSVMVEPETLRLAAVFIAACFGGKALAAVLTRPLLGYGWPEVGVLFSLTIPQAAATLAATVVGFNIGLFSTSVVNAVLVLIVASLVVSAVTTPIFTRKLPVRAPTEAQPGRRVLLLLPAAGHPRRAAIELAARLAGSDDGIVLPVAITTDADGLPRPSWPEAEPMLLGLGVDHPIEVFVDRDQADGLRHAASSFRATAVVVDDPDGAVHDELHELVLAEPVLFVGHAAGRLDRAAVVATTDDSHGALSDMAGRLARSIDGEGGADGCDLLVQEAGSATPDLGDRSVTLVRVLCAR